MKDFPNGFRSHDDLSGDQNDQSANRYEITWHDGKNDHVFSRISTPAGLDDVLVTHRFVERVAQNKDLAVFANYIVPSYEDPAEVWLREYRDDKTGWPYFQAVYITAFDDVTTVAVATNNPKSGWLAWKFDPLHELSEINAERRGILIYCRPDKGEPRR